jgi:hypothetical protein
MSNAGSLPGRAGGSPKINSKCVDYEHRCAWMDAKRGGYMLKSVPNPDCRENLHSVYAWKLSGAGYPYCSPLSIGTLCNGQETCEGQDCDKVFDSLETCLQQHKGCPMSPDGKPRGVNSTSARVKCLLPVTAKHRQSHQNRAWKKSKIHVLPCSTILFIDHVSLKGLPSFSLTCYRAARPVVALELAATPPAGFSP